MKRDHREISGAINYSSESGSRVDSSSIGNSVKGKSWEEDQDAGRMDELLAILGYKIQSSDMADVAQKLEILEMVIGTAQEDEVSHLSSDTVHYNPSNLSSPHENGIISGVTESLTHPFVLVDSK